MARPFTASIPEQPSGKLRIEEVSPGYNKIYFIPPEKKLIEANFDSKNPSKYKRLILEINDQENYIKIYPLNTLASHENFLESKYQKFRSITLDGFNYGHANTENEVINILEELPLTFIKDYDYGLGFQKNYRFIIDTLENWDIQHLIISKRIETSISEDTHTLTLKYSEFDKIRRELNNVTRKSQLITCKVKTVTSNNFLSYFLKNEKYPQKSLKEKFNGIERLITESASTNKYDLSHSDRKTAIDLVSKNRKTISQEQPETLIKLHNEIELVTLEVLIEKYEQSLTKKLQETYWQKLFNENPFILSLVFGYPVMKIRSQAFVGGTNITGSGEKISDFLVKNNLTNNTAIFEIKTPSTKLLNQKPYRDGVFTPSTELSGATNQLLDQQYQFQRNIAMIKENSKIYDLETYSVHGILIIGKAPTEADKQKSFELFRGNSKGITIITFDELLERLKHLHKFLES